MVNESGRRHNFSLPLAALVHQQFVQAISAGYELTDDCNVMRLYLFGANKFEGFGGQTRTSATFSSALNKTIIIDLLKGIHTAMTIEVLKFANHLDLDITLLQKVVHDAAGSSKMFNKICALNPGASAASLKTLIDDERIATNMVCFAPLWSLGSH